MNSTRALPVAPPVRRVIEESVSTKLSTECCKNIRRLRVIGGYSLPHWIAPDKRSLCNVSPPSILDLESGQKGERKEEKWHSL